MQIILDLKDHATKNGVTQEALAMNLGVTFATLNRWLNGKSRPRKNAIIKIDSYLNRFKNDLINKDQNFENFVDNISMLDSTILSEKFLEGISSSIKHSKHIPTYLFDLISSIPDYGNNFDWNIGSILQHFNPEDIIDAIRKIENLPKFYNSIGLVWVLGELNRKDPFVIGYLYNVLKYSNVSDVVWRAAFSIESLVPEEDAVVLLKRNFKIDNAVDIHYYLDNIQDKKSIIGILIKCDSDNTQKIIYPKLKSIFLTTKKIKELINCSWLIGRLNLIDNEILKKISKNVNSSNYELKYYTFFALQHNSNDKIRFFFEKALSDNDPLIRKMASRSIRRLGGENSLSALENALLLEDDSQVVGELTKAIYSIKNPKYRADNILLKENIGNENGMISDETDKWYKDSSIYNSFSEAEDPQNLCFDLIKNYLGEFQIINPVDLATGTGRYLFQILKKIDYQGTLYGIDFSEDMCNFVRTKIRREKQYVSNVEIIQSSIESLDNKLNIKSNFIVSSFGFPSRISDKNKVLKEINSVYNLLSDDGYFVTVGWDETFNDELNHMWYKYIPDSILAKNFEDWRRKRVGNITGARNCNLKWFKRSLNIPLQFASLQESSSVMGYLFGREAAKSIIKNNKTDWNMSLGITIDTKESLKKIIKQYERN